MRHDVQDRVTVEIVAGYVEDLHTQFLVALSFHGVRGIDDLGAALTDGTAQRGPVRIAADDPELVNRIWGLPAERTRVRVIVAGVEIRLQPGLAKELTKPGNCITGHGCLTFCRWSFFRT